MKSLDDIFPANFQELFNLMLFSISMMNDVQKFTMTTDMFLIETLST